MTPGASTTVEASVSSPPVTRVSSVDGAGALLFLLIASLLMLRLNKGADLSDESYYALYVDDWLKGGIGSSTYLVLHQTAALLVFPFAWLYLHVTGSTDGMFLFLRCLYLLGSVLAAAIVVASLRRIGPALHAWLVGLLLLAFIPFGLPAPSYNTIGLQALCVALAAYGSAVCATGRRTGDVWLAVSAAAWVVTTVAYPPMSLAGLLMAVLLVLLRHDRRLATRRYLVTTLTAQAVAWAVVAGVLSGSRLLKSVQYTAAIAQPGGLAAKLGRGADLLAHNSWFGLLCAAAICVGVARRRCPPAVMMFAISGLIALSFIQPPALFTRSHDVMTLLALTGAGLMWDLRPGAAPKARLLAIMYSVSLVAGVTTMVFATNLLFNFCIGAAFAATLTFTGHEPSNRNDIGTAVAGLSAIAVVLTVSVGTFYGDTTAPQQARQTISHGFFAGIKAGPDDIRLLEIVRDRVAPLIEGQARIAYIGRNPGVVLTTTERLQMLSSYPLAAPTSSEDTPKALAESADYYSSAKNRPPTVIIYRDPLFAPANPFGGRFAVWYRLFRTEKTPLGVLEIYRRR
jgi:hypothetical protein